MKHIITMLICIFAHSALAQTTYSISPNPATVSEGAGTLTFTITRSGSLPAETIYASTTQTEGYSNSSDYTGILNQSVSFTSGATTRTVSVTILNDSTVENSETFGFIVQRNTSDPVTTYLAKSTFTITDNDTLPTTYSITPNPATVGESAGSLTFTITRSGGTPAETIYASTTQTEGYSNSSDYTGIANQSVTFTSGQTTRTVSVTILNDSTVENSETFGFIVQRNTSDPVTTYLAKSTFTITDDDVLPTTYAITPNPATVGESAGTLTFTITRSGGTPAETIYASTTTTEGYANSSDYTGIANQSVTFTSGQTTRTVSVTILNDSTVESSETFGFIVQRNTSDPVTTYLAKSTFTITDDDVLPTTYSITPNPATVDESAGTLTFTITRSGGTPAETIYASTTQTEGYSNSGDYTGIANQSVTFTSGQTTRTVAVTILDDSTQEGSETFGFIVQRNTSDPVTTYLAKSTFTITDNDVQPTTYAITPNPATVGEAAGTLTFTITRSGGTPAETIYASTTQAEGYSNNSDYTGIVNQSVTFTSGQTTRTVAVTILDDSTVESSETFGFIVQRNTSDPVTTYLAKSTFTITDNDTGGGTVLLPGSIGYIRQINNSDMHPAFNSANACGPCSATMILTYFNRLTAHPMIGQSGQNNDFSWYVAPVEGGSPSSTAYSYRGFTFNVGTPDVVGGTINYGAFGYLTQDFQSDPQTRADRAVQFLWKHGLFATFANAASESDVRAEIDAGRPVFLSAQLSTGGHIMVIRGYNPTQLIAADPWVRADLVNRNQYAYTWSDIHYGGAAKWIVKSITPIAAGGRVRAATSFNVRLQPTTSAGTAGAMRVAGQLGTIVSDATLNSTFWNADGLTWTKIQWDDDQAVGWSAIGSSDTLWIEPISTVGSGGPSSPLITSPKLTGTTFTLNVPSESGFNYVLEYKNTLNDATWIPVQTNSGSGGMISLTNYGATGPSRIYRVRVQQ